MKAYAFLQEKYKPKTLFIKSYSLVWKKLKFEQMKVSAFLQGAKKPQIKSKIKLITSKF